MNIVECPAAVELIITEAFAKTISDAKESGLTLTKQIIVDEVTSNPNSAISKRFLLYVKLGQEGFAIVVEKHRGHRPLFQDLK